MSMSISYEATGRTSQKARTRAALIGAARDLMASGATPTVEQAAAHASIARATAYRYFPNRRALLTATFPQLTDVSLLGDAPSDDPAERLERVVEAIARQCVEHEAALRNMLRLSLEEAAPDLPFRKGRRIIWVHEALAPLQGRIPPDELERLVLAISAAVGIDALVWLTDIAGLSREESVGVMRWSARSLLRAALAEHA